jgi:hypothetical protein
MIVRGSVDTSAERIAFLHFFFTTRAALPYRATVIVMEALPAE